MTRNMILMTRRRRSSRVNKKIVKKISRLEDEKMRR